MGGRGSGRRHYYGAGETTEDYRTLDVRRLQREGLLEPGRNFLWQWSVENKTIASINVTVEHNRLILDYRHRSGNEEWQKKHYPINLSWTPCHFGSSRAWFICPAAGCSKRVAILYGGSIFACRQCYQLVYPSQRESTDDRSARRADKIRKRFDWELGILNGNGERPKGMHQRTYERLIRKHDAFVEMSLAGIAKRLGILEGTLDDFFDG